AEARYEKARIEADCYVPRVLGADFKGVSTDLTTLRPTVKFADAIALVGLPPSADDWMFCEDYENRLTQLRGWLETARDLLRKIVASRDELAQIADNPVWKETNGRDCDALNVLATRALDNRDELHNWNDLLRLRAEGAHLGLERLVTLANSRVFEPEQLAAAFAF